MAVASPRRACSAAHPSATAWLADMAVTMVVLHKIASKPGVTSSNLNQYHRYFSVMAEKFGR
jgi:hypothetical protein